MGHGRSDDLGRVAGEGQLVSREGTTWRYAITRERIHGEDFYTIREVYTGPDGELSWTEDSIAASGESWMECADDLALMTRAMNSLVLDLTLDPPAFVSILDLHRANRKAGR